MKVSRAIVTALSGALALLASQEVRAQSLSEFCRNIYAEYAGAPGPKAFVTEQDGGCWWWYGTQTLEQSEQNAMNACTNAGGYNCRISESSF